MARSKRSEKEIQRDKLKALFPDAVDLMKAALRDEAVNGKGQKMKATLAQKLAIAHRIVDQVVGRPAQAAPTGPDNDRPPVTTLEVSKSYDNDPNPGADIPDNLPGQNGELIPDNDPEPGPGTRAEWLEEVEKEALAAEQKEAFVSLDKAD